MPHVISQKCITEVYAACQQVCPAEAMHTVSQMPGGYPGTGQPMMVIHPEECIDCAACKPECPIDAILSSVSNADDAYWAQVNANLATAFHGQRSHPRAKNEHPRRPDNRLR